MSIDVVEIDATKLAQWGLVIFEIDDIEEVWVHERGAYYTFD